MRGLSPSLAEYTGLQRYIDGHKTNRKAGPLRPFAFATTVGVLEGLLCLGGLSGMLAGGSFDWHKARPFILGVALPVSAFVGWQSFKSVLALLGSGPSFFRTLAAGIVGGAFIGVAFILVMPFLAQEKGPSLSTLLSVAIPSWLAIGMVLGLLYAAATWLFNALLIRLASAWLDRRQEADTPLADPPAHKPTLVLAALLLTGLVVATLVRQGWRDGEPVELEFVPQATVTTNAKGLQGAVREDGKEIIPHQFAYVSQVGMQFFLVRAAPPDEQSPPLYGVWSIEGREVIEPRYQGIQYHSLHQRFRVSLGEASPKFGYLDEEGREVLPLVYDQLERISNQGDEPTNVARQGDGYGYVDIRSGQVLIEPVHESIHVSEQLVDANGRGIVLARQGGKWGVLDTQGRALTAFQYDELDVVDHETLRGRQGETVRSLRFQAGKIQP